MNFKKLGNTDLNVSTICLGTMTWGEQNTQEEGFEQMDYALDQGVNFWDTAELYSVPPKEETYGHTEIIIGNWFKKSKKRDKVILATKVAGPMRAYLRGGGNNFGIEKITQAVNDSLKRLQTDYIDLYQLHWPERNTNMFGRLGYEHKDDGKWNKFEDILGNLKKFIDQGKIRYVGLSNETAWGAKKYLEISKEQGLPRMMSIQNPYSLLNRTYEVGLAEVSIREQIGLLAYSPLASGYLKISILSEIFFINLTSFFKFLGYLIKSAELLNCVGFTKILTQTISLSFSAFLISETCPWCKEPMVGTNPIVFFKKTASLIFLLTSFFLK